MPAEILLERRLPPLPTAPAEARRCLRERLRGALPEGRLDDVLLVASELVANSVMHAGLGPGDAVRLRLRRVAEGVRVEVSDAGGGYRPDRGGGAGGRGLGLVAGLSSCWGLRSDGGTAVWAELPAA
ncbi:ATP-binding protein [Miltoncostaea marina]|uniref:ATP-binding protein n=1 Tax=Miltoncostaea marina TaxID=2843215 RepID=UPI001C3CADCC|nr:ATP-binding protein [Miltoncostaea marina]